MGRLHSNGKGISGKLNSLTVMINLANNTNAHFKKTASAIPYSRTPPSWLKVTPEQARYPCSAHKRYKY